MSIDDLKILLRAYKKAVIREHNDCIGPVESGEAEEAIVAAFTQLHKQIEDLQRQMSLTCITCKHEHLHIDCEPCASCIVSSNWEAKPENEYTYSFSITSEYEWEPGVPISLVSDKLLKEFSDQMNLAVSGLTLAQLLRLSAAQAEIIKRKQQGHDPCELFEETPE